MVLAPNVPALVVGLFARLARRGGGGAARARACASTSSRAGARRRAGPRAVVIVARARRLLRSSELLPSLLPRAAQRCAACLLLDDAGGRARARSAARPSRRGGAAGATWRRSSTRRAPRASPRACSCAHDGSPRRARAGRAAARSGPEDASVLVVPVSHAFGLACLAGGARLGRQRGAGGLELLARAAARRAVAQAGPRPARLARPVRRAAASAARRRWPGMRSGLRGGRALPAGAARAPRTRPGTRSSTSTG